MSQNIVERSINITSIVNNFKSLITQVYEKRCTHIFNKKIDQNIYFRAYLAQGRKTTHTERRKADWFLIIAKIYIFLKSNYYKSKTDTLYQLNVYKNPAKEYQVVDC